MIGILENRRHSRLRALLSAYIDSEVNESEAMRVEEHLSGCDECRRELGTLRATVELMGQLPELVPQRAYTLAARPEPAGRGWSVAWTARAATSLAGLLVVALLLSDAFGIVTQRDIPGTAALPAVAPALASREIEEAVVVERTVAVEKEAEAPVAQMAAPAPVAALESAQPVTAAAAPAAAQAMAPPADIAEAEAPTAATPEAPEGGVQVELKEAAREPEVEAAPDDGALATPEPATPPQSAPPSRSDMAAEDAEAPAPEPDDGLALPLWQLEVAAAVLFLALILGMLWSARSARRPWG